MNWSLIGGIVLITIGVSTIIFLIWGLIIHPERMNDDEHRD